jgi:DNA-binding NarL/FixJ family response regulator
MIELIIADDHPVMIEGIRSALKNESNIQIVAVANNGDQLLKALTYKSPDIVLMDVSMQDLTGIDLARIIHEKYKDVKILFLTQFDDKWLIKKCLDVGAKGYLIKSISKKELIFSIQKVVDGEMDFFYKSGKG